MNSNTATAPDWNKAKQEWLAVLDLVMSDEYDPERELVATILGYGLAAPLYTWIWQRRGASKWQARAITTICAHLLINRSYIKYYYQKSLQSN